MNQGDISTELLAPLRARRLRLHTQHQAVIIMRTDRELQATLLQIEGDDLLAIDQIALTETAWQLLRLEEGAAVTVTHAPTLESLASVRRRIYGNRLDTQAIRSIVKDVAARRYTDVHLAAFLTATAALPLDEQETADLTGTMVEVGERLRWSSPIVVDKHCIGGLPGNRTTPIVVAIVAAHGLVIPKTSSPAITSPAGTADAMETLAPVDLDISTLRASHRETDAPLIEREGHGAECDVEKSGVNHGTCSISERLCLMLAAFPDARGEHSNRGQSYGPSCENA